MFPKTGKTFPSSNGGSDRGLNYPAVVADALRSELGTSHQAVKTIMRWTGAEERTVKNWLAGTNGPSGPHLITLFRHSDAVLGRCLLLAGRERALANAHLPLVRTKLRELLEILEITAD